MSYSLNKICRIARISINWRINKRFNFTSHRTISPPVLCYNINFPPPSFGFNPCIIALLPPLACRDVNVTLNLRVPDDGADDLERLGAGGLHAHVRVAQHLDEARHDGRQARRQLLRRAVRHRAQQLDGPCAATRLCQITFLYAKRLLHSLLIARVLLGRYVVNNQMATRVLWVRCLQWIVIDMSCCAICIKVIWLVAYRYLGDQLA